MKKISFVLLLIFLIIVILFSIRSERFNNIRAFHFLKKSESINNWMKTRIQKDLKSIQGKVIQLKEIDDALAFSPDGKYLFLKIVVLNNTPTFFADSEKTLNHQRTAIIKKVFNDLCLKYRLPTCAILFSLHDQFDCFFDGLKVPVFVFAKNKNSQDRILFPDFEAFNNNKLIKNCRKASQNHPWEQKKEIVFFRGGTSNKVINLDNYLENPRFNIVYLSQRQPDLIDASFTFIEEPYKNFPESICPCTKNVSMQDHFAYKYLIDIDGHSCGYSRCRWILLSNSVTLKCESDNIQWFYDNLVPFKHYVPIKNDLSDLEDKINWIKTHDNEARKIASDSTALGEELFSNKAVELYIVKLLREYAKCFDSSSLKN